MFEVQSLVDNLNNLWEERRKKVNEIELKIARLERKKDKLNKVDLSRITNILYPLAKAIMEKTGLKYFEIYGPFGVECETSIYFANTCRKEGKYGKESDIAICDVETYSLTLQWDKDDYPMYWTGEETNEYPKGSFGELNGMNHVFKRLPNTLDEIIAILKHSVK